MIEIRTLGRTSVLVDGEPLSGEAAWPKSLALIIYMAREPGPDRREEILSVLWPDREEKRARRALNQLLYTLRKTSPKLDLESVEDAIDFGREVWLDVEEFERRYEDGDFSGAIELYEGPFLSDLSVGEVEFDHWVDRERETLRRKFRKAALDLAAKAKETGDREAAVEYCRRLIHADPLDDEAQHLLIESLYLRGDRVEALRQFETYRDLLARELEVEPLDHTRELVARIRGERPSDDVDRPPADVQVETPSVRRGAAAVAQAPRPERPQPLSARRGRWIALAGIGAAIAAVAITLAVWLRPEDSTQSLGSSGDGLVLPEAARIAVLPFQTHGLGADDEGLSLGIAQLISLNLDGMGPVETANYRLVAERWRGGIDAVPGAGRLRSLAEEMGASAYLRGDLHASGDEVRLVADLTGAESGRTLAQVDLRGPRDDLLQLVDRLSLSLFAEIWTGAKLPEMDEAIAGHASPKAIKHYLQGTAAGAREDWYEAVTHYEEALKEDLAAAIGIASFVESRLRSSGVSPDAAGSLAARLAEWVRRGPRAPRAAQIAAALEFASGRPSSGNRWLVTAQEAGLPSAEVQAWRALLFVYGVGVGRVAEYPGPGGLASGSEVSSGWVRDTWLFGAIAWRRGDFAGARAAARALASAGGSGGTAALAARLARALEAELALGAGDTLAAVAGLKQALDAPLAAETHSLWTNLPYYRYRLVELEMARGESGAATAAPEPFSSSLGDLVLHARTQLALGEAFEAVGDMESSAAAYSVAARWWAQAEPPLDSLRVRAEEGRARTASR